MWGCIKVIKNEGIVSMETIFCVFSNYVLVDNVDEAIMMFEVMENYGFPQDIVALNGLLSEILPLYCKYMKKYVDYLVIAKSLYGEFITCSRLHNLLTIIIDKSLYLQTFLWIVVHGYRYLVKVHFRWYVM